MKTVKVSAIIEALKKDGWYLDKPPTIQASHQEREGYYQR